MAANGLISIHRFNTTCNRGKYLVTGALFLLIMITCVACQIGSPAPASTPTLAPTPTLISISTLSPDDLFICQSSETSEYVLPFPVGVGYICIQGYVGRTYHFGVFKYGIDFAMPIGSMITAAREGRVIHVEVSHSDQEYGTDNANVVIVSHEDGTFGRYVHLTKDGTLVIVGQRVVQGDPIGLSGSSGDPGNPHLHFDVTIECSRPSCRTIPVCFSNTKPHTDGLVTNEFYAASSD